MRELELKYGCNPHQIPARLYREGGEWKFQTDKIPLNMMGGGVSQVAESLRDFRK